MRIEFYEFLLMNKFKEGIMYKKSVFMFMEKYDIAEEDLTSDALIKSFQRWRNKIAK